MKKMQKRWLITAAALVGLGLLMLLGTLIMNNWSFSKMSMMNYETNSHTIGEAFHSIAVETDTASIRLLPSEEGSMVICRELKKVRHSVEVQDGTLKITAKDERKWYDRLIPDFGSAEITVYLPRAEYEQLCIHASTGNFEVVDEFCFAEGTISLSTGDICIEDISAGNLALSVSTGNVNVKKVACEGTITVGVSTGDAALTDLSCKNLKSSGSTGGLFLKNVIASEAFWIERSTGDVNLEDCDAAELKIKVDTGDVEGSLLSPKVFIVETDTGRVEVPKSITGGKCEITTDTGDVKFSIK